ncbi:phage integrase SAM-like domain and Arm DNA-binding domain-containing protein [Flavobacterium selenitireducens]|uniref:phage integrase SAM-like domain and Arm DNA-binding domain-containing protein n=1 Tax=Flavobacterium selenitireducens TaxID=2722704 RepID=UPI00168B8FA3|nr:phage integrase SAM-like domain and Arm DNA-binding domain-containing protein [Flavobacterium selenitireducens]MBD3581313.1 hypothetical protein [Flavobacterium selenitireducens]
MNAVIINLFYLKRSKVNSNGLIPIYHRTTIGGKRIEKSTGKYVDPARWCFKSVRMSGASELAQLINSHLDSLVANNAAIEKKLIATDQKIDVATFSNILSGKADKQLTIINVFKDHNAKIKVLVPHEYSAGTLERYETSLKHTVEFMVWKYKVSDIVLSKIDNEFVAEYDFYLRSIRKCNNNTTVKYLKNFKKIIQICLDNKWMKEDPFAS